MSDYIAQVYPDPAKINHGDAVHYRPEEALTDADLGYEGAAPSTLDDRLKFLSNGPWWDDLRVTANTVKIPSSNPPAFGAWLGTLQLLFFDATNEEQVFFSVQLPHGWLEGSTLKAHVHWVPSTTPDNAIHRVRWGLDYNWANVGDVFPSTTSLYGSEVRPSNVTALVPHTHYITPLGDIDGTGKTISSMLNCRLFRDATDSADDYAYDAGLLEIDFHYQVLMPGSRQEYIQ